MTKILQTLLSKIREKNRFLLSGRTEEESADTPEWMQFASAYSDLGNGYGAKNIQEIRKRAQSDTEAQYALGIAYAIGDGVPRDAEEAKMWLACAAAQGHEEAENIISAFRVRNAKAVSFEDMDMIPAFWHPEHPAGIVYLATQVAPAEHHGKSYFGSTHISHEEKGKSNSVQRALRRRKCQHYLAASKEGQLSPFRQALAPENAEFDWAVAMVTLPPPNKGEGKNTDWRWCAEAAEAWHIHHFGTMIPNGYNQEIPHVYRTLVELDQVPILGENNQYKGCLFCINDANSKHPGDITQRAGRAIVNRRGVLNCRSWTKSFFPNLNFNTLGTQEIGELTLPNHVSFMVDNISSEDCFTVTVFHDKDGKVTKLSCNIPVQILDIMIDCKNKPVEVHFTVCKEEGKVMLPPKRAIWQYITRDPVQEEGTTKYALVHLTDFNPELHCKDLACE